MAQIKTVTIRRDLVKAHTYEQIVIEGGFTILATFKYDSCIIHPFKLGNERVYARFKRCEATS